MNIYQIMTYYAICAICAGFFGWAVGKTQAPEPVNPVEVIFELCGNGAPLVKDGKMYMVVCVPMRVIK